MSYRHRNALYLRISTHIVVPLYLYLDDKHTSWMNDRILQQVIADLKPLIIHKWREEEPFKIYTTGPKAKKFGIVDVHRGDDYQVAYFLQRNEAHHLLVKSRYFSHKRRETVLPKPLPPRESETPTPRGSVIPKTRQKSVAESRKRKRATAADNDSMDVDAAEPSQSDTPTPSTVRRSVRSNARRVQPGAYADDAEDDNGEDESGHEDAQGNIARDDVNGSGKERVQVKAEPQELELADLLARASPMSDADVNEDTSGAPIVDEEPINVDEDDEESKPSLQLRYMGHNVPDVCLTIIVEPWGTQPETTGKATPAQGSAIPSRFVGMGAANAPPERESSLQPRDKTPLFRDFTPQPEPIAFQEAKAASVFDRRPPVPLFHEETPPPDNDFGTAGLLQFSQAMNIVGNAAPIGYGGDASDEDDADAFLGDADEAR